MSYHTSIHQIGGGYGFLVALLIGINNSPVGREVMPDDDYYDGLAQAQAKSATDARQGAAGAWGGRDEQRVRSPYVVKDSRSQPEVGSTVAL
jgi:hypothetical protein